MSLINEALKKAQRQRTEGTPDATAAPGGVPSRRGQPRSAKSLALIAVGAVALVIVSVTVTIRLGRQTPPVTPNPPAESAVRTEPAATSPSSVLRPPSSDSQATRVERAPTVTRTEPPIPIEKKAAVAAVGHPPSAVRTEPAVRPPPADSSPKPNPAQTKSVERAPIIIPPSPARPPVASSPAPATVNPPAADLPETRPAATPAAETPAPAAPVTAGAGTLDERINAYLDTVRITGVKASGSDSRVLMNERVYRLNDFVERTLQLRLIKVETNNLTFSDANGAIYVKYF